MSRPSPALRRVAVLAVATGLVATGCRDDGGAGDTGQFCALVQENVEPLRAVPETPEQIQQLIDLYAEVGDVAPLAIEPDWSALTLNLETAFTSEDDEEILSRVYATERSAVAVTAWLRNNCGIDFGTVATIVAQTTTTSTIPTPPTTTPG